jgi:hypothetical protein
MTVPGGSYDRVMEVGTFNTHANFIAGRPNGRVWLAAKTHILVDLVFQRMVEFNPTSTTALMVQLSVLEVSCAGLIPFQASLSIQPTMEVSHHHLCLLR